MPEKLPKISGNILVTRLGSGSGRLWLRQRNSLPVLLLNEFLFWTHFHRSFYLCSTIFIRLRLGLRLCVTIIFKLVAVRYNFLEHPRRSLSFDKILIEQKKKKFTNNHYKTSENSEDLRFRTTEMILTGLKQSQSFATNFLCLFSEDCNKRLDNTTCASNEDQVYCKSCYGKAFGPKGFGFGGGAGALTQTK